MIYEIAKALKGVQQWRPFGDFRATATAKEIIQVIQDEMTVSQEEYSHIKLSKEWKWNGLDWISNDNLQIPLIGKNIPDKSIAFLRLTKQEYNTFVNDKRNQFKQSPGYETIEKARKNHRVQEIPGNKTIERSIHHYKHPTP